MTPAPNELTLWRVACVIVPIIGFAFAIAIGTAIVRVNRRRLKRLRSPLTDEELCAAIGVIDEPRRRIWIEVRRAIAAHCGVVPELIHPDQALRPLWHMTSFGPDALDVVFRLEKQLQVRIPRSVLFEDGDASMLRYAEFRDLAEYMVERLVRQEFLPATGTGIPGTIRGR